MSTLASLRRRLNFFASISDATAATARTERPRHPKHAPAAPEELGGVKAPKSVDMVVDLARRPAREVLKTGLRKIHWAAHERLVNGGGVRLIE
jgi:hypothetical protein